MSGNDYEVPARSWDNINEITTDFRRKLGQSHSAHFPIMETLELVLDQKLELVRLEIFQDPELIDVEGYTCPTGKVIALREDVYHAAWRGDGRARFTAAHELGHWLLHTETRETLKRAVGHHNIPPYRLSEPQANQFAAELLMPREFFSSYDSEETITEKHGVSWEAATNRLKFLRKKGLIPNQKDPGGNPSPFLFSAPGDKG